MLEPGELTLVELMGADSGHGNLSKLQAHGSILGYFVETEEAGEGAFRMSGASMSEIALIVASRGFGDVSRFAGLCSSIHG